MALIDDVLLGAHVKVELAGLPPIDVDLSGSAAGESSAVVKLLKPRITVSRGGMLLFSAEPAGRPEDGLPLGLIALVLLGLVALYLLRR